ncbi:MAG: hypothetical protein IJZ35_01135 [Clostridia bacterium]|nr:hypothetical protein [Clostridia bacterium]
MIASITQFWYLWLVLVVLVVALVLVMRKASAAMKKRSERIEKEREFAERFKYLVNKYSSLDSALIESSEPSELAEGVTAVLQYKLEKSVNPDEEYKNAEQWKREVYALYYFSEDCQQSLSYFFRNNGEPLPSVVLEGLKSIGYDKIYSTVAQMYSMYDENNENVSLDKNRAEELDVKFRNSYDSKMFFELIKNYIVENCKQ